MGKVVMKVSMDRRARWYMTAAKQSGMGVPFCFAAIDMVTTTMATFVKTAVYRRS